MILLRGLLIAACLWIATVAQANDRLVRVYVPPELIETGIVKFITPRFTLKTQVRITLVDRPDQADMVLGDTGQPVFQGVGQTWHLALNSPDHPGADRFADWLRSDVGQRTIFGYAPEGVVLFSAPQTVPAEVAPVRIDGDAALGLEVSRAKCARCHRVEAAGNAFGGLASTPSFMVLRTFEDWDLRFAGFYLLKPHPAFTQIEDVTDPFPIDRPSPIVPIEMTLADLEAMLAYVATMSAANLGAPLQHQ